MNLLTQRLISLFLLFMISGASVLALEESGKKIKPARVSKTTDAGDYRLSAVNIGWWENFNDPYLSEYIHKTVIHNHDLKIASLKTQEYYQNIKAVRANELPQASVMLNYFRVRTPALDFNGINIDNQSSGIFAVPLVVSYEADIFLKNHDKTKLAKKGYEASKYEEKAAYISLAASTAATYFNIVKLDKIIALQENILKTKKEIYDLTVEKNKSGLSSAFETTFADKQHTAAMIELNDLKKQRTLFMHQLAVLTGESPANIENLKRTPLDEIEYKGSIPDSINSEIVVQRPDLMKAEAQIEMAKIDVKIARKEFLPSVPIIGTAGFTALELDKLFDWKRFLALISANLVQNVYSGGLKTANLKTKKIRYEEMFETYKKVDLQAIQEINDSLCQIKYDTQKDKDNLRKYELEKSNFNLVDERYKAGISSYLDKIQFKESLLSLEKEVAASKTQRFIDYLSLYKSVGGAL